MIQYLNVKPFPTELSNWRDKIEIIAADEGLDFFPTHFEVISYQKMNEIAAFGGFPTRYPHWRFGMEYEQLSKSCLLYTSPSPRDATLSRMPSSA